MRIGCLRLRVFFVCAIPGRAPECVLRPVTNFKILFSKKIGKSWLPDVVALYIPVSGKTEMISAVSKKYFIKSKI